MLTLIPNLKKCYLKKLVFQTIIVVPFLFLLCYIFTSKFVKTCFLTYFNCTSFNDTLVFLLRGPQSVQYFIFGPLRKMFADPWSTERSHANRPHPDGLLTGVSFSYCIGKGKLPRSKAMTSTGR